MSGESLQLLAEMRAEYKRRRRFRYLASFWHKLIGGGRLRAVTRLGMKWKISYYQLEKRIVRDGIHEPQQIEHLFTQSHKRGCNVFLDIGANIGLYSMLAAKTKLFAEIHAIEPSPDNFPRLQWHINENNFTKTIAAHQTALSDSCGKIRLSVEEIKRAGMVQIVNNEESGVEVQAATLDSLFNFDGRRLAVKMDIEGHEIPALRGAENLFAKNAVFLQVEVLDGQTETINYLISRGFRLAHYIGQDFYFERERQQ